MYFFTHDCSIFLLRIQNFSQKASLESTHRNNCASTRATFWHKNLTVPVLQIVSVLDLTLFLLNIMEVTEFCSINTVKGRAGHTVIHLLGCVTKKASI